MKNKGNENKVLSYCEALKRNGNNKNIDIITYPSPNPS